MKSLNLFSIFDPTVLTMNFYIPLNWLSYLIPLMIIIKFYWKSKFPMMILLTQLFLFLLNSFKDGLKKMMNIMLIFNMLFIMIMLNNLLGLFPYIFTSTSHMIITLSLALPLWLAINMFMLIMNFKKMMSHMLPKNTPMILSWFMVIIELISNLIRPITLSVRLAANMLAGHLLLSLISMSWSKKSIVFIFIILILLLILELAVAFIQSYVFTMLFSLYIKETK
uniref:ATP synthase subunit a n=1 Tax=Bathynella cf. rufa JHS-2017 TaxID=2029186 RepID=A0A7R6D7R4_9CRUS|nr:ATP synthase F0 subunit 6 [Bathynella cf. rufa JHS-2017]